MGRKRKVPDMEGVATPENTNPSEETMENVQPRSSGLPSGQKGSKNADVVCRRSGRIRNLATPVQRKNTRVEEIEIDFIGSEQEEEPTVEKTNTEPTPEILQRSEQEEEPHVEQTNTEPPPKIARDLERKIDFPSLESKIDFLVQSVKEFKSKGVKTPVELTYRSLYIESQNKVEKLTKENHELAKNLELANRRIENLEQYGEQMNVATRNLKDVALVTNLGRAHEVIATLSSQLAAGRLYVPEAATTTSAPPLVADANTTASPASHKKYSRRRK